MANAHQPRRRGALIALAIAIFVLTAAVTSQVAFNLTFLRPESTTQTLVFAALSAVVFLLFVALVFVLARNLLKLSAERRIGVLGSRFRVRMVMGALVVSFLPVIFMFLFSYALMNRSIDKWFSRPVEELRQDSRDIASLLTDYARANADAEAQAFAASPQLQRSIANHDYKLAGALFSRRSASLQDGFALLFQGDRLVAAFNAPPQLPPLPPGSHDLHLGDRDYLLSTAPVTPDFRVVVAMPLPPSLTATLARIDTNQRRYSDLAAQRKIVRRTYMELLLMLTVLVLFAATWISMFIARLVTRPVAALAEATQEISRGNLEYRVSVAAADEIGDLIISFNQMAGELDHSRKQIESSRLDLSSANSALSRANSALEQQRSQMESIVQNVPAGVLSLDAERRISHVNHAVAPLLRRQLEPGLTLLQAFDDDAAASFDHLLRRADRMGSASREIELDSAEGPLTVEATAASLKRDRTHAGYVIVLEDLSDVLRAQKQAAWREVARRIAHELKNPLTPIGLSAERIKRHLDRSPRPDEASLAVIHGCAETITGAVETMRTLVDQFSLLARFPAAQPRPSDLNKIVEGAMAMFRDRLQNIDLRTHLAPGLPPVMADPDGIRRVIANLVDNAAEALDGSSLREIHVSTSRLPDRDMLEVTVSDTGHGVSRELKEKLFLPYFSTKERGTGLGLAIVGRIVEEHGGSVRVEENRPAGSIFIIELPVAQSDAEEVSQANA